jgi:hypothetical protein
MMYMGFSGFGGLGALTACGNPDLTSVPGCADACIDDSGNVSTFGVYGQNCTSGGGSGGGSKSSSNPSDTSTSAWQKALTALTAGATAGVIYGDQSKQPPKVVAPTPWYASPIGIIAIVGGIGLVAYMIAK